jgi:hypothetical protein
MIPNHLHRAAPRGHPVLRRGLADQVPRQFLTKETMTMTLGQGFYLTGSGYRAKTETPLHLAVQNGHADQIPMEFLTPEFLSIEACGYRETVLHYLARQNRLDLVPAIYANSPMWNLKNNSGQTPRGVVEANKEREVYVARVRSEPATEKQKEKLRWFGCTFDAGMELFRLHGITFYTGDAFAAYALGDLVRCFEKMLLESNAGTNISMACVAASTDPALQKATITPDQSGQLVFTWPKRKLQQWYRKGAKF